MNCESLDHHWKIDLWRFGQDINPRTNDADIYVIAYFDVEQLKCSKFCEEYLNILHPARLEYMVTHLICSCSIRIPIYILRDGLGLIRSQNSAWIQLIVLCTQPNAIWESLRMYLQHLG